jgi:hypothetical protein
MPWCALVCREKGVRQCVCVGGGCLADISLLMVLSSICDLSDPAAGSSLCRNLFDYDQVVNTQRDRVYAERRRALLSDDLSPLLMEYAEKTCDDILEANVDRSADPSEWRLDALAAKMVQYCPLLEGLTGAGWTVPLGGAFGVDTATRRHGIHRRRHSPAQQSVLL